MTISHVKRIRSKVLENYRKEKDRFLTENIFNFICFKKKYTLKNKLQKI